MEKGAILERVVQKKTYSGETCPREASDKGMIVWLGEGVRNSK